MPAEEGLRRRRPTVWARRRAPCPRLGSAELDLPGVGADRAVRADRSNLIEHAMETGKPAGSAQDHVGAPELRERAASGESHGDRARYPIHRPVEGLETISSGTSIGMQDQEAVQ